MADVETQAGPVHDVDVGEGDALGLASIATPVLLAHGTHIALWTDVTADAVQQRVVDFLRG